MFERLATRALFWAFLVVVTAAGGLTSVGASWQSALSPVSELLGVPALQVLPTLGQTAPFLSLAAFGIAIAGWRRLHRALDETHHGGDPATLAHVRQWREAIQASADGVFLLSALRDHQGQIVDFRIVDVNASGARLARSERASIVGRRVRQHFAHALSDDAFATYAQAITDRTPVVEDIRVNRRHFDASWLHHQAVPTADGIAITIKDISDRKREEMRLRRASQTDELTQLYNRRGFLALAEQRLNAARRENRDAVLLYVDMDDFKALNDVFGHAEGDRALAAVGRLLKRSVRDGDVVARMGGDEFTIVVLDADRATARSIQKRIEERVALLNATGELAAPLSLTIGHTRVQPTDDASLTELLARADALLYARKKRRRLMLTSPNGTARRQSGRAGSMRGMSTGHTLTVPSDVAAIARAAVAAASARFPTAPNGAPYVPTRMA